VGKVLHTGKIVGLANHTVLISRDGSRYQIADSAAPIRHVTGRIIGVVLVFRDVTEEYALREKIAESEERMTLALKGGDLGTWDWDFRTDRVQFNDQWAMMKGYDPWEIEPKISSWEGLVHPDDLPRQCGKFSTPICGGKHHFTRLSFACGARPENGCGFLIGERSFNGARTAVRPGCAEPI